MIQGQFGMANDTATATSNSAWPCPTAPSSTGGGTTRRSAFPWAHERRVRLGRPMRRRAVAGSFGFNLELIVLRNDGMLQHYWHGRNLVPRSGNWTRLAWAMGQHGRAGGRRGTDAPPRRRRLVGYVWTLHVTGTEGVVAASIRAAPRPACPRAMPYGGSQPQLLVLRGLRAAAAQVRRELSRPVGPPRRHGRTGPHRHRHRRLTSLVEGNPQKVSGLSARPP